MTMQSMLSKTPKKMPITKRPYHRYKPVRDVLELVVKKSIQYGFAVIPYDERLDCWLLPAGPNQKNRRVKDAMVAREFAIRLNDILNHYPHLMVRVSKVA